MFALVLLFLLLLSFCLFGWLVGWFLDNTHVVYASTDETKIV